MDADRYERISAAIAQLGPTEHVCTLYEDRDAEVAIAASYIRAGLERGELCVCVVDDGGDRILDALTFEGVDVTEEMSRGRLAIFEKPLEHGLRTRDMLDRIEEYASTARTAGHAGFR